MKSFFALLFALAFTVPAAFGEGTGLGLTVGNPTGATGRTWIDNGRSLDYGFGWAVTDSKRFQLYGGHLWSRADAFRLNEESFDFFFGAGLAMRNRAGKSDNELSFGPRVPVGVSYLFGHPNLELFGLFAVNVGLVPATEVFLDLHLGARFYLF